MASLQSVIVAHLSSRFGEGDAAEQMQVARQFNIHAWIPLAMERLVLRVEPLTSLEVDLIGSDMIAQVIALRERNRENLVHRHREEAHEKLFDAWVEGCPCKGCQYAKEVTTNNDVGLSMRKIERLAYDTLSPEVEKKIREGLNDRSGK
jgi:hypothetical protein